jgi:hypothetical protein
MRPFLVAGTVALSLLAGCGGFETTTPFAFEVDGVAFHVDDTVMRYLTPDMASEHLRLTMESHGQPYSRAFGWRIVYLSTDFDCGDVKNAAGCFHHPSNVIELHAIVPGCPPFVPLAHEVWHALGNTHEPDAEEQREIHRVDAATKPQLYAKYCSAMRITYAVSPG